MWNLNKKRKEEEHDTDVRSNYDRKGDFRLAVFVFTTVRMIFCADAKCWELI